MNGVRTELSSNTTCKHSGQLIIIFYFLVTAPLMYCVMSNRYDVYGDSSKAMNIDTFSSTSVHDEQTSSKQSSIFFFVVLLVVRISVGS